MDAVMDISTAKVGPKGRITVPGAICDILRLRTGDKISFSENPDGSVTMRNANVRAFENLQKAMEGAAEEAGLETEDDVVAMVRELRTERRIAQKSA